MAKVMRGNVEYTVNEDQVESYLERGFCQIDEHGEVLRQKRPQTIDDYKALVARLEAEIERLKAPKKTKSKE